MPRTGFEPAIPASERPQIDALEGGQRDRLLFRLWNTYSATGRSEPNVISEINVIRVRELLGLKRGLKNWYRNFVFLGFL